MTVLLDTNDLGPAELSFLRQYCTYYGLDERQAAKKLFRCNMQEKRRNFMRYMEVEQ